MILALLLAAADIRPADKSPAAARAVVERYYSELDRGRYAAAYRLWSGEGRASGKSFRTFAAGFGATQRTTVRTGVPSAAEGAAGSVFVTVPVRVDAVLKDGTRQHFAGRYILRRVNDVDGASPEQRHWHIAAATLRTVR
jgi:hypothetical protein